jgi:plastocyanin
MTFRRRIALAATLGLMLLMIPAAPAGASGGGGCGGPVTNERGTAVDIDRLCFKPTVLYSRTGDPVTWTNLDAARHNIAGANLAWGSFELLRGGRSVSYSFSEPGVYSYVCTMHPGMVGTVVVGHPRPSGVTSANAVRRIKPVSAVRNDPVPSEPASEGTARWFPTMATFVMVGGLLVGARLSRRARPRGRRPTDYSTERS